MTTFTVCELDVWGNHRDGYEVNDVFKTSTKIDISDEATDKDIIRALKQNGLIRRNFHFSSFEIDGGHNYIFVDYKGKPVYQLWSFD